MWLGLGVGTAGVDLKQLAEAVWAAHNCAVRRLAFFGDEQAPGHGEFVLLSASIAVGVRGEGASTPGR